MLEGKAAEAIRRGRCPYCDSTEWYEGPHGGLSVNIECAGCGARFNLLGPFGAELLREPTKPSDGGGHVA